VSEYLQGKGAIIADGTAMRARRLVLGISTAWVPFPSRPIFDYYFLVNRSASRGRNASKTSMKQPGGCEAISARTPDVSVRAICETAIVQLSSLAPKSRILLRIVSRHAWRSALSDTRSKCLIRRVRYPKTSLRSSVNLFAWKSL